MHCSEFDRGTDPLNIETAYLSLIVPYKILWQKLGTIWSAGTAVVETLGGRRLEDGLDIISIIHDFVDFGNPAYSPAIRKLTGSKNTLRSFHEAIPDYPDIWETFRFRFALSHPSNQ